MIDNAAIKTAIATALEDDIGLYTFSSGLTTPAIRLDDDSDPYPEEPKVTGLEVIVQPSIDVSVNLMIGGYSQTFQSIVALKQWDITKTTLEYFDAVMQAIAEVDDFNLGQIRRQVRSNRLDNIETLIIPVSQTFLA